MKIEFKPVVFEPCEVAWLSKDGERLCKSFDSVERARRFSRDLPIGMFKLITKKKASEK